MKRVLAFTCLAVLTMSCGILEFAFTDIPQRYIEREVKDVELVGSWKLTSDSEARIGSYVNRDSSWSVGAPWKTILFNSDGTCQVKLETPWTSNHQSVLNETDALASCTWRLKEILGHREDGTFRDVLGISMRFEHFDSQANMYKVLHSKLFIAEENNELILWDYIGDLANVNYQDFKKTQE